MQKSVPTTRKFKEIIAMKHQAQLNKAEILRE